eukprot:gene20392-24473_t
MCTDFRALNAITKKDLYPLPNMMTELNKTREAKWLSKVDLAQGYHQVKIREGDEYKTAFRTSFGSFEYTITPFGLSNAGPHFQRLMDEMFNVLLSERKISEVRSFIGLVGYYRRFIKNASTLEVPLLELTKDSVKFVWTDECDKAFATIKLEMSNVKHLYAPVYSKPFYVECDASNYGIGHVLYQMNDRIQEIKDIISFGSRKLTKSEINYTNIQYLKNQYAIGINTRINRWLSFIESFNPILEYIKGETNVVPDGLSRCTFEVNVINAIEEGTIIDSIVAGYRLEAKMIENGEIESQEAYDDIRLEVVDGVKYIENRIVVPLVDSVIHYLLDLYHNNAWCAHANAVTMIAEIKDKFIWSSLVRDTKDFCQQCETCHKASDRLGNVRTGLLQPLPIATDRFVSLSCDFIVGLPPVLDNGRTYNGVWVIVDRFSKYVTLIPTHTTYTSADLIKIFYHDFVKIHGIPLEMSSDKDSKLMSQVWKTFADRIGVNMKATTPDHQQANGQSEIMIRAIKNVARTKIIEGNGVATSWKQHDFKVGDKVYVKERRPSKKRSKMLAVFAGPYIVSAVNGLNITIQEWNDNAESASIKDAEAINSDDQDESEQEDDSDLEDDEEEEEEDAKSEFAGNKKVVDAIAQMRELENNGDIDRNIVTPESHAIVCRLLDLKITEDLFTILQKRSYKVTLRGKASKRVDYLVRVRNALGWYPSNKLSKTAPSKVKEFNNKLKEETKKVEKVYVVSRDSGYTDTWLDKAIVKAESYVTTDVVNNTKRSRPRDGRTFGRK